MDEEFRDLERRYLTARARAGLPPLVPPPTRECAEIIQKWAWSENAYWTTSPLAIKDEIRRKAAVAWLAWWKEKCAIDPVIAHDTITEGQPLVYDSDGTVRAAKPDEARYMGVVQPPVMLPACQVCGGTGRVRHKYSAIPEDDWSACSACKGAVRARGDSSMGQYGGDNAD